MPATPEARQPSTRHEPAAVTVAAATTEPATPVATQQPVQRFKVDGHSQFHGSATAASASFVVSAAEVNSQWVSGPLSLSVAHSQWGKIAGLAPDWPSLQPHMCDHASSHELLMNYS